MVYSIGFVLSLVMTVSIFNSLLEFKNRKVQCLRIGKAIVLGSEKSEGNVFYFETRIKGERIIVQSDMGYPRGDEFIIGDSVEIIYSDKNPRKAYLKNNNYYFGLLIALEIVSIAFTLRMMQLLYRQVKST
jgi:hypothetical protein